MIFSESSSFAPAKLFLPKAAIPVCFMGKWWICSIFLLFRYFPQWFRYGEARTYLFRPVFNIADAASVGVILILFQKRYLKKKIEEANFNSEMVEDNIHKPSALVYWKPYKVGTGFIYPLLLLFGVQFVFRVQIKW